ncbi:MAG TPA: ParB N-terminal domain-containing protein [Gaiellaceae bacterium]|nr:ParB N-terminal domain-containing protein [Gaiellaceae bacterium]
MKRRATGALPVALGDLGALLGASSGAKTATTNTRNDEPRVLVEGFMSCELLPLDEATTRLRPFSRRYLGVHPIDVEAIVGTDSRGADFDREFAARRTDVRERLRSVERAFPNGDFPPIVAYKLGEAYFVLDGHHRVAAARRRRMKTIDAEVTELTARWRLGPDADLTELVHAEQERLFMSESGLVAACPDASCFRFTRPVGYLQLLEAIQSHGYRAMLASERALSREEVALDWYRRVYLPTVEAIHDERLDEMCPEVTDSDRFLWVSECLRELAVEQGTRDLGEAARVATRRLARRRRGVRRLLGRG